MTNAIDVDGTKAEDLTQGRSTSVAARFLSIVDFLRTYVAGFEDCYVISAAPAIGVRETRHFEGEYAITEDDILAASVFDDWVVPKVHFNFDVHNLSGAAWTRPERRSTSARHVTTRFRTAASCRRSVDNLYPGGPEYLWDAQGSLQLPRDAHLRADGPGGRRGLSLLRRVRCDTA